MTLLPPNILKCMSPADRKALGTGGLLPEEALAKAEVKNERQLHKQVLNLLRLKGIEPITHATHKRSTATLGTPDILFTVQADQYVDRDGAICSNDRFACAWELKWDGGKLSKEQEQMHVKLSSPPNSWRIRVIRSVDDALEDLHELGIE